MQPDPSSSHVKVRLRLRPDDHVPAGERLWAQPREADEHGGTFELTNCAIYTALAVGDVVRASLDGDGDLQVVDVVEPCGGILTSVLFPEHLTGLAREAGDTWRDEHGALWSEGGYGVLKTIWRAGVGWGEIKRAVAPYAARGLVWLGGVEPAERRRDCLFEVDFELDRTCHGPSTHSCG